MNRKEGLDDLATRISALVNEQPNDGQERAMTVTVGGDNHGAITFGNHITINAGAHPVKEERPLTDSELRALAAEKKRERREAQVRRLINLPVLLTVIVFVGIIGALLSGYIWQFVQGPYPWAFPVLVAFILMPLAVWTRRVIELEGAIIREANQTLEQIRHEQHRRRVR
ncbi:hypothetical protein [Halomonas sp. H5]|uniref:hypothetical protein n=1 Tax=Halomonas sp. H5 TaxID=3423910 RepID=UPI003D366C98